MKGRELLKAYLRRTKESQRSLERRLGVKPGTVCRYLKGLRTPAGKTLFDLEAATGVPASSWFSSQKSSATA